jgi:hypothetical protein
VSSNLTRSTKRFKHLRPPHQPNTQHRSPSGVQTPFDAWAGLGTVWILIPARCHALQFKEMSILGTVGTVFRVCCLLETTTFLFPI